MSLLALSGTNSVSGGYDVDYSCKFEHDNAESLSRAQAQGNQQTWTFSTWIKRTQLAENSNEPYQNIWSAGSSTSNATHVYFRGDSSYPDNQMFFYMDNGGSQFWHGRTPQSFRDTSAWLHLVWAVDTTQATASNRSKIYINGEQITLDNVTYPNQNASTRVMDNGGDMYIGALAGNGGYRFNGYLAETVLIDGTQLAASDFGEFDSDTGIWKPIDVSGLSFGTRGFYLDYSDAANLGNDADGSTVFTENYLSSADQSVDSPTNNFCTLNPLMANAGASNYLPIAEGGTKAVNTAAAYKIANSTFGVTSGKWYWEVKATDVNGVTGIGVTMPHYWDTDYTLGGCIILSDGRRYNNSTATSGVTNTYTDGDIIGFALDMDATPPTLQVYKNNTSEANLMNGLSINGAGGAFLPEKEDGYFPKVVGYNANTFECNFGGYTSFSISSAASDANGYGTFEYAPPSGYYALCTKNLAEYG